MKPKNLLTIVVQKTCQQMTRRFRTTILLLVFFLSFVISHPASAHAVGYSLSLYPPLLRVNIKPGKTITQIFKIDNLLSDDKFFVARLVPFNDADLFGNPTINLKSTAPWLSYFSLANSSIKLGEPFLVKGGSSEQLILSLAVPENAPVKDLYATLLVSTYANINGISYQGSLVSATIGSNLLITVASEAFPPTIMRIQDLAPRAGLVVKIGNYYFADNITPLSFTANAFNSGNFTAETKGLFKVSKRSGEPVYLEGILPVNVISKTKRTLLNNLGQPFSYSPDLGVFGPYRITVSLKTENANAENSLTLIFVPFKISLGLLVALLVLGSIIKLNSTTTLPKNE